MLDRHGLTPQEVVALKREILSSLHCAMPGIVESFDSEMQTASIRPADPRLPILQDVPVFMPMTFEISPGDACLLIFADYDIDRWLEGNEEGKPASARQHSLSDAFALVGFRRGGAGA